MEEALKKFYYHMVAFQKKNAWTILFVLFLISGVMLFYALRIEVDSTLDQQLKPEDDYLSLKKVMSREFEQTDSFFVVVRVDDESKDKSVIRDLRDPEVIRSLDVLERSLLEEPEVKSVSSIASVFKKVFGRLPNSLEESKEWVRLLGDGGQVFFRKDMAATLVNVSVNIPTKLGARDDTEKRMFERVQEVPFPIGAKATLTGLPTLLNRIIKLMISDSISTMAIALFFVFFVLIYLFRRLSLAVIIITPIVFAIIWLAGTMSLLGIRISVANATVAAMVIGLGVDYAIHLVNSFDTKVKKNERKPITSTVQVVGSALFISFLTTLTGFSVNMLGSTEALRVQGLTLALGVTFAFISTMAFIPVLLKLKIEILREEFGAHKWK